jgi:hypothetical protein
MTFENDKDAIDSVGGLIRACDYYVDPPTSVGTGQLVSG